MREVEQISLHQDNDLGGEDEIPSVVSQSFHIDEGVRDKFLPFSSFSSGEKINHAVCLDCGSKNECRVVNLIPCSESCSCMHS